MMYHSQPGGGVEGSPEMRWQPTYRDCFDAIQRVIRERRRSVGASYPRGTARRAALAALEVAPEGFDPVIDTVERVLRSCEMIPE